MHSLMYYKYAWEILCCFFVACDVTHEKVTRWLSPVTSWYRRGIRMGVLPHKLKKIELDYPNDVDRRKHEVVDHWMRNDPGVSLSSVADILEECEEKVSAQKLRKECNDSHIKGKFIMASSSLHTTEYQ